MHFNGSFTKSKMLQVSKANIKEMRPLAVQLDMLMQELLGGVVTADPNFKFPDGKVEPHRTGFPGLLGDPGTEEAIQVLEARYEQVYRSFGEIDERPFLRRRESDATPFVPGSTPPSMTKCQVATPVRSNRYSKPSHFHLLPDVFLSQTPCYRGCISSTDSVCHRTCASISCPH